MRTTDYSPEEYPVMLNEYLKNHTSMPYVGYKKTLNIAENEEWFQLYSADDPARKTFDGRYFISNKLRIVRVTNAKNVKALNYTKEVVDFRRRYYTLTVFNEDGTKRSRKVRLHIIAGLVLNSVRWGRADDLLYKQGLGAFGSKKNSRLAVNCHHINHVTDNRPEHLQFLTTELHDKVDRYYNYSEESLNDDATMYKYMKDFGEIISKEEPDHATLAVLDCYTKGSESKHGTTQHCEFLSIDSVMIKPTVISELENTLRHSMNHQLINFALRSLIDHFVLANDWHYFDCFKYFMFVSDNVTTTISLYAWNTNKKYKAYYDVLSVTEVPFDEIVSKDVNTYIDKELINQNDLYFCGFEYDGALWYQKVVYNEDTDAYEVDHNDRGRLKCLQGLVTA